MHACTQSYACVLKLFEIKFEGIPVPNNATITQLIKRFKETSSILDRLKYQKQTVMTLENVQRVPKNVNEDNRLSIRRRAPTLGLL